MSSRISQRAHRRRNQRSRAMVCSTTQRWAPRPEPCSVPRRVTRGSMPPGAHEVPVLVEVVGGVGVERVWTTAGPFTPAAHRRDGFEQRGKSGDAVAVPAGRSHRWRDTAAFGDHLVFGAGTGVVDRARPGFRPPPFSARVWEPSIAARDQSISPAAFSLASNSSCSCGETPASVQSRSRRQHVIPRPVSQLLRQEPPRHPVYSTKGTFLMTTDRRTLVGGSRLEDRNRMILAWFDVSRC